MSARNRWILLIVAFLAANVIATLILAISARGTKFDPSYHTLEKPK